MGSGGVAQVLSDAAAAGDESGEFGRLDDEDLEDAEVLADG